MVELNIAKVLYALALLSMSLNYGIKPIFGIPDNVTWIDPTLILSAFMFCLRPSLKYPYHTLAIIFVAILSATSGYFLLHPEGQGLSALYNIYREPIRLTLNIIWFWVSINFLKNDRKFVLHWYAISVIIQFIVAIWLLLGGLDFISLPSFLFHYANLRVMNWRISVGPFFIPRLWGTFSEPAPFGLFMFSSFVVLSLALFIRKNSRVNTFLLRIGWVAALAGSLGSLSDQVLLGMLPFCMIFLLVFLRKRRYFIIALVCALLLMPLVNYTVDRLMAKTTEALILDMNVKGASGGERAFHTRFGLKILSEHPNAILFGIGPGRYGDYAVKTGLFPSTVTPQVTLVEWLVGYGVIGCFVIIAWIWLILKEGCKFYGIVGFGALIGLLFANMFQANWLWEAWFFAIAFLCVLPYNNVLNKKYLKRNESVQDLANNSR